MSDKKNQPTGEYSVGYCRPPQHTRFPKGTSGNPAGPKPKAKPGDVIAILENPVTVTVGGKKREMQPYEASFRQLTKRAFEGHLPSIIKFIRICEKYGVLVPPPIERGGGVVHAPERGQLSRMV